MSLQNATSIIERLEDLLTAEREYLITGRARQAAELAGEKLSALEAFQNLLETGGLAGAGSPLRDGAARVLRMAEENAVHLDAVRNGLKAVIHRIETMGSSAYVGSYGKGGAQMAFPQATGSYHKRV